MSITQYCYALSKSIPGYSRLYEASLKVVHSYIKDVNKGQRLQLIAPSRDKSAIFSIKYAEPSSDTQKFHDAAISLTSSPDTYIDWQQYDQLLAAGYDNFTVKATEDVSINELEVATMVLSSLVGIPGMLAFGMGGVVGLAVYSIMAAPIISEACKYIKGKNFNYKNNIDDVRIVAMHLALKSEMLPRFAKLSEVLDLAKKLAIAILHTPGFTIEHFREEIPSSMHAVPLLSTFEKLLAENTIVLHNNEYIHIDLSDSATIREKSICVFGTTAADSEKNLPFKILAKKQKLIEFYRTLNEPKSYGDQKIDEEGFAAMHYQKALDYLRMLEQSETKVPAIQVENVSSPRESIKLTGNTAPKAGFFQSKV